MRKILGLLLVSLFAIQTAAVAQMLTPVKWTHHAEAQTDGSYLLHWDAKIDDGWYVYSQNIPPDGPVPTTFNFEDSANIEFIGALEETGDKISEGMDKVFEMEIKKFAHGAQFQQKVKLKKGSKLVGYLQFMTCDDTRCLPPTYYDYEFTLATSDAAGDGNESSDEAKGEEKAEDGEDEDEDEDEEESNQDATQEDMESMDMGSQMFDPVKWEVALNDKGADGLEVVFESTIDEGWYVYSSTVKDGPIPTSINYLDSSKIVSFGAMNERGEIEKEGYDEYFDTDLKKFGKSTRFAHLIQLAEGVDKVEGYIEFMACDHERCLPPKSLDFSLTSNGKIAFTTYSENGSGDTDELAPEECTASFKSDPISDCNSGLGEEEEEKTLGMIFILGFIGGFIALLTPCVFPMIPLTVTFFTKRAQNKGKGIADASLYAFSIVLVYFLLSVPFLIWEIPPNILNVISADPWMNTAFFVIFIVFAISFFGYFEITLPSSIANKVDSASDVGGMMGIFFMGLTLAIVSFSCTGPILGSLLVGALTAEGGSINLVVGMTGFGLALALPFGLFAAFPQMMNTLPKSGGWLNTVKVNLAYLELGFAMKFISTADMTPQAHFIPRELFLIIWILIAVHMALYNFGFVRFPHDSPVTLKTLPKGRWITGFAALAFALYLIPGPWGKNLSLVSGFTPPLHYSWAGWASDNHCPLGLNCYHDYEEGLEEAIKQDKPIMIDFTGWACVNCRKMEENVWPEPAIHKLIDEEYILISLYVDENTKLKPEDQYVSTLTGQKVRTVGDRWADFQGLNFGSNSQPLYVLLDHNCRRLNQQVGYTPDVEEYRQFLQCGLDAFNATNTTASAVK